VSIPALSIRDAECHGWLYKQGGSHKNWKRRYCVLKDKCLYYYKEMTDQTALGVMKMQGYKMTKQPLSGKKHLFSAIPPDDNLRTFHFYTLSELEFNRFVK
jgi:tripartite motif-containing protein 2/3